MQKPDELPARYYSIVFLSYLDSVPFILRLQSRIHRRPVRTIKAPILFKASRGFLIKKGWLNIPEH